MADFKCEPGKILNREEVERLVAYDNAGVKRPDAYDDVVFDATGISGTVYRCKTAEEKKLEAAVTEANAERTERVAKLEADVKAEAAKEAAKAGGGDLATEAVNLNPAAGHGSRAVVNDAGPSGGDTTGTADVDTTPRRARS